MTNHPHTTMPAEWAPHEATWLAWPHHKADWPGKFAPIPFVFAEMIRLITLSEPVRLLVKNQYAQDEATRILTDSHVPLDRITFIQHRTNRGWLRDCGPTFVRDAADKPAALHWRFNAWAKYPNYTLDATVAEKAATHENRAIVVPKHKGRHVVMEGGAIDVNGEGVILTTEECLLSKEQCRNPGFTHEDYEAIFAKYYGATHTIWLGKGVVGDDTHGHVDDLARFASANTIVAIRESNPKDENYSALEDNWKRLQAARDANGNAFTLIPLPMPQPVYYENYRLPASYANFYITNGHVIVPVFNDPADRDALAAIAKAFPDRQTVGLYARDLVLGLGVIHCLTQQQPKL